MLLTFTFSIGTDPFGNHFIMSVHPESYGQIYFWDHEEEPKTQDGHFTKNCYFVANSFSEFVNWIRYSSLRPKILHRVGHRHSNRLVTDGQHRKKHRTTRRRHKNHPRNRRTIVILVQPFTQKIPGNGNGDDRGNQHELYKLPG